MSGSRVRLEFLDGLRGLAALYVVFCHADIVFHDATGIPPFVLSALRPVGYGHYAVALFIVLSGYCLMLPVARSTDDQLRGGGFEYIRRRARRILPPYYAALVLSLLIDALPLFRRPTGLVADAMFPAFGAKNIVAHLLLLHNLSPEYTLKINAPMWSIAPEWQIYFLLPAALLPLWRRFGIGAAVAFAFFLGLVPHFFLPAAANLDWTAPWYIGLFSLGMAASLINFRPSLRWGSALSRAPWLLGSTACTVLLVLICLKAPAWEQRHLYAMDILTGLGASGLILYCTRAMQRGQRPPVLRFLNSRPVVGLGTFSYSLYLVHFPLMGLMNEVLLRLHPTPVQRLVTVAFAFVPITVFVAYLFHLAFERRFLSAPLPRPSRATETTLPPGLPAMPLAAEPEAAG